MSGRLDSFDLCPDLLCARFPHGSRAVSARFPHDFHNSNKGVALSTVTLVTLAPFWLHLRCLGDQHACKSDGFAAEGHQIYKITILAKE